jgi:aspartate/methionine/tyrosine aminotransferase
MEGIMNALKVFKLEEYLSDKEHRSTYTLCCSDAESLSLQELLALADAETLEMWENLRLGYVEVRGSPAVRREIATLYPTLSAKDVLCFAGAQEAIFCLFNALIHQGDEVIVFNPYYQSLGELPRYFGANVIAIPLCEEENWRPDLQKLSEKITKNTKAIVLNFPHNPSGSLLTEDELQNIVHLASRNGIYIISDEVFRLLGQTGIKWVPPVATQYERGVSISVMSKAFGLGGVRVGWAVTQDKALLNRMEGVKHYTSISNGASDEVLAIMALRSRTKILTRNSHIIDRNLHIIDMFMKKYHESFAWMRPQAGCIGLVRTKNIKNTHKLAQDILSAEGILLMPGEICDAPVDSIRIGFGRANMPEAFEKFENFIVNYK